jgi:hypothetical protein
VAVLGAALLIAGAIIAVAHSMGHHGRGATSLSGSTAPVLTLSTSGILAVTNVDGSHQALLPALGRYNSEPPSVTLDGRYLVAANGTVIALDGRRLATVATHAVPAAQQSPAYPDSLADHDQQLVLTAIGRVSLVSLATGHATSLGVADAVAGDPQQAGVFVSVASGQPAPTSGSNPGQPLIPDGRVELRDSARPTMVLATAVSLNRALGYAPGEPVALAPYPNPAGDLVAISVTVATGTNTTEGVVTVDRSGRVRSILPAGLDPLAGEELNWSANGNALAYGAPGSGSSELVVWVPGSPPSARADPTPGDQPIRCLWSPTGTSILCETLLPGGTLDWDVAGAGGGPVSAFPAPGPPLAWLPAGAA